MPLAQLVGELDDQDAVLADQADQCHQPHLGVDVHAGQAEEQRDQRAADRQRHRHQDHQRIAEALELRGQHQEDDRHRQGEGHIQGAAFLDELARRPGVVEGVAARRFFPGDLPQGLDGLAHADDRHALDGGRVELLELDQLGGARAVVGVDHGGQRQHLALLVAHVVAVQPARIGTEFPLDLGDHLVAAAFHGEAVDLALAEQDRQGLPQALHGHAHLRRLLAVDLHHQLRLVEGQVDVQEGELARRLGALLHPFGHIQQQLVVVGGVDDELEGQAFTGTRQRGQVEAEDLQAGYGVEACLHFRQQFHLRALPFVPGLEQETADAALHAVEAVDLEGRVVLGEVLEDRLEGFRVLVQVVQVGGLRRAGHHEDHPLVLVGRQFALGEHQQRRNQREDQCGEHQHHRAAVQGGSQRAPVAVLQAVEQPVDALGQSGRGAVRAQQMGAHHRREGQRDDAGDDHRAGQGEGELLEQHAGDAGQQADRRIHRRQGDGHRHHRQGDLPRAEQRRLVGRVTFLDMPVDVLHHHDGVVHHQADGQHHGQQGEQVDRVAHQLHEEQHADHRQRDGHHRDQHRAQRAEEQEHHQDDDQHGLGQGLHHLVDGRLDEARGVVGDLHAQAGRQLGLQFRQQGAHAVDHVQRVGAGGAVDADVHRGNAVEGADAVVAFRAHLHPRHIAQQHPAVALGAQGDGGEVFRGLQVGVGIEAGNHVLALHLAGGGQEVVAAHCVGHVPGRQAVGRQAHRVDPQAHGEHLVAEDFRLGNARQGGQLGLHHARQVVGDLRVGQRFAEHADVHQCRGVGGLAGQHRVLGLLRQAVLHLVGLGQQLGEQPVAIAADARIDGNHRNVLAAHRGHVVDAFGAGQALLQRLGDVALDGLGVGARVGGGHGDQHAFHLRILADRQALEGLRAEQQEQQADHAGQHRAADEGIGQGHGCLRVLARGRPPAPG